MSIQIAIDETHFTKKRYARIDLNARVPGERQSGTRVAMGEKWLRIKLESS